PFSDHELPHTKLLSGLGVPDARQSTGDWFYLTSDSKKARELKARGDMGGFPIELVRDEKNDRGRAKAYSATIEGPENFWLKERLSAEDTEIVSELAAGASVARNQQLSMRQDEIRKRLEEERRPKLNLEIRVAEDAKSASIELQNKAITSSEGRDLGVGDWS